MPDRKSPPPFVHSTSFDLIDPVRQKLSNGVEVFFVSGGSQEVLKLELIFFAGRWYEIQYGSSHFSGNLLTKGTKSKNSYQIAQLFDRYGAHVEISPGFDFVSVSVYTLIQYLRPVLELLLEIISGPEFPDRELEQNKAIFIQNLKVNEEKTSFLASKFFRKNLFGGGHPYGREIEENDANSIRQEHLIHHYNSFYNNTVIFVSGKIDHPSVELISSAFQQIPGRTFSNAEFPSTNVDLFNLKIEKQGSVQASIRSGKKSLVRGHTDYAYVVFVSHILGGYFGSRLMRNIREEKGLTYGISASLHALQRDSFILIGTDVNRENIELTLDEIRKELKALRTERISNEELETAKNHFIGSLQSEITTPFAHADKIKTTFLSNLPRDYYQQMILQIDVINPDKILEISEKYLHEDTFSSVSVG